MTRVSRDRLAALATCMGFGLLASPASAFMVSWDIDPSQSSFTLAIPDQNTTLGTLTATMRLRNQNNTTWTTNSSPVDGALATDIGAGISSIQFLGGQSSLTGVNTGSYRPNPAVFSTSATDATNTAGSFTATTTAPAVFGARVNASVSIISINVGYISFSNVSYDLSSLATAISGTSFLSNAVTVGIADSTTNFDSVSASTTGIGDGIGQTGPINAVNINAAAGSITYLGGGNYKLVVPINMPVHIDLSGVVLNATATGTLVGFAFIPEPATLALMAIGVTGLAIASRKRRT